MMVRLCLEKIKVLEALYHVERALNALDAPRVRGLGGVAEAVRHLAQAYQLLNNALLKTCKGGGRDGRG